MILRVENQNQISQLIRFGEKELIKYEENSQILKSVKLKDRIQELIRIYYTKSDEVTEQLKAGQIDILEFQMEMIQLMTDLYSFIVIDTKAPVGFYVDELTFEIQWLLRFGHDIQNERIGLNDALNYRASLYMHSAWVLYQKVEQYWAIQIGKTQERIVCEESECEDSNIDWQRIGITKRINEKSVGKKCWCEYQFE